MSGFPRLRTYSARAVSYRARRRGASRSTEGVREAGSRLERQGQITFDATEASKQRRIQYAPADEKGHVQGFGLFPAPSKQHTQRKSLQHEVGYRAEYANTFKRSFPQQISV